MSLLLYLRRKELLKQITTVEETRAYTIALTSKNSWAASNTRSFLTLRVDHIPPKLLHIQTPSQ